MGSPLLILIHTLLFSLLYFPCLITGQQNYTHNNCRNSSLDLGFTCNGVKTSCSAFIMYRAQPPYTNISSIASLFSANASRISSISNMSETMTLPTNTEVIIPVTCSCAGNLYQSNTTYQVQSGDNYYLIANNTFEGLTTCSAIRSNKVSPNIVNIFTDQRLTIPIRCACPTKNQLGKGLRYLMSFVVVPGNSFSDITAKFQIFGADIGQTMEANSKTEQDSVIQPFTTLLIPLRDPPNGSAVSLFPKTKSPSPPPPPSSLPPSSPPPARGSSNQKWAYFGVGVVVGGAFILVAGTLLIFILLRRERKKRAPVLSSRSFEAQEKAEKEPFEFLKSISSITSLKVYGIKDLHTATDNFSSDNWIEGCVHKGVIEGDEVAIKKMNGDVSKEISVLNNINHFNLIGLLGVCFDDGVWYLVYEYASNGPLSDWIYQESLDHHKTLNWGKRMQVASDVATGLNYLHRYTTPPHVHKDIKSGNILLDGEFRAKIGKFGLSRTVRGHDGQFTLTDHIVGTKGYLAPEYMENGLVTPMLDVYSFGVLLLEMLTGKDVASLYEGVRVQLSEVLAPLIIDDETDRNAGLKGLMDPCLGEFYPEDVAISMVFLADRCLKKDPGSRPSMDEIVQILSKTVTTSFIWESSSSATTSTS